MDGPDDSTDELAKKVIDSLKEQRERMDDSSRRSFLTKSALAGGSLLAISGASGVALAQDDDDDDGMGMNMTNTLGEEETFDDVDGTDVDVLNYALTLEHLEYAFYRDHLEMFSEGDFEESGVVGDYSSETDQSVYEYLETIRDHEETHVDVLSQAVTLLGGEPVSEAEYDFGVESVDGFLQTARVLEKTGVGAYTGAAPFIESPDLVRAAASILSVEANHMSLLNEINGMTPIPNAFNPALSQEEVFDAAGPFIQNGDSGSE